jgi:TonB-dependent receptor
VQYAPTSNSEFYLRAVGSQFDRSDVQYTNRYQIANNSATAIGPRSGSFRNAELRKQVNFLTRDEQTWMAQIGGESRFDLWTFSFMTGVSENELDIPEQLTGRFRVRGINVDIRQTADSIIATPSAGTAATSNPSNPANYAFDNLTLVQEFRTDDILNAQMDATRDLEWGSLPGYLKFGLKFHRRDKDVDRQETSGNPSGTGGVPATTLANLGLTTLPTRLPGYGFMPNSNEALALFRAARGALQPAVVNSAAQDFFVEERVDAAYLMGSVDISDSISVFGGVRFEDTTWITDGNEVDTLDRLVGADVLTVRELAGVRNSYGDVLPSLHLRWNLSDSMVLRAALTSAVIRPNFDEGSATRTVSTREITGAPGTYFRSLSGGNPELDPLTADQFDVSLGWYPTDTTFLYAGAFYKRIDNFFVNGQFVGRDVALIGLPVANGSLTGGFDVANVILNGDRATVKGIELAFEQAFVDLPGLLSGLFVSGNATFLDSKAKVGILRPNETLPLPDQADRIANLSLGWESERFTVRASANYRDEQLDTVSSNPDLDQVLQPYFSLDFNLRWNINDAFQLYFDAVNLNERKDVTVFRGDASGPFPADEQVNDFGRSYGLGVRYTF